MKTAGLTQTQAAELMGLKQPDLSAVLHGRLNGYSVERLARCLSALGDEVRLTVKGVDGSEDSFVLEDAWPMLTPGEIYSNLATSLPIPRQKQRSDLP